MYVEIKKKRKTKKAIIIFLISAIFVLGGVMLFKIYADIEVKKINEVDAQRLSQTISEKNNEDITITQMLATATDSVVGISKLKNNGNTIFSEDGITQMGIGSGVII